MTEPEGPWSASEGQHMPDLPTSMDPDEFRSRKAAGGLQNLGRKAVRQFMARVLTRRTEMDDHCD